MSRNSIMSATDFQIEWMASSQSNPELWKNERAARHKHKCWYHKQRSEEAAALFSFGLFVAARATCYLLLAEKLMIIQIESSSSGCLNVVFIADEISLIKCYLNANWLALPGRRSEQQPSWSEHPEPLRNRREIIERLFSIIYLSSATESDAR